MMKYPRSRAIRLAFSILLLVLILLMLGYALYNLSNLSPDSIQTEEFFHLAFRLKWWPASWELL
jgi:hypothetical protein